MAEQNEPLANQDDPVNQDGSAGRAGEKPPVITLRDVWKTYKTGPVEFTALKGINLDVESGEFTAIMGPSGSGKSTLMNILGCLDRKDTGSYVLNGTSIADLAPNDLARIRNQEIGFIFQSFNLLPKLNILDNVELPMVYADVKRRERVRRAAEALDAVGLMPWARHRPNEISGGQKQRVAIARAMVLQPSLLLADEPTGNLDSQSSLEIMKIIKQLNQQGSTILLITHEAEIAAYANRVIRIVDGAIVSDSAGRNAPQHVREGG
jgi:putative ABC transport system ATP-binding protein